MTQYVSLAQLISSFGSAIGTRIDEIQRDTGQTTEQRVRRVAMIIGAGFREVVQRANGRLFLAVPLGSRIDGTFFYRDTLRRHFALGQIPAALRNCGCIYCIRIRESIVRSPRQGRSRRPRSRASSLSYPWAAETPPTAPMYVTVGGNHD